MAEDEQRMIPEPVREIAVLLVELFACDRELAVAINDASARLRAANEQLTTGRSAEDVRRAHGPMGPDRGPSGRKPAVLADDQPIAALERVAQEIHSAFIDQQRRADERRMVAFEIGEANGRLIAAMIAAGYTEDEARHADARELAGGRSGPGPDDR